MAEPGSAKKPIGFSGLAETGETTVGGELGLTALRIASGAFHDALRLIDHCPTGMVFVPSKDGVSHNTAEYTDPGDLTSGTQVLAHTVVELADR